MGGRKGVFGLAVAWALAMLALRFVGWDGEGLNRIPLEKRAMACCSAISIPFTRFSMRGCVCMCICIFLATCMFACVCVCVLESLNCIEIVFC